jgi:hypothetical protein
MKQSIVSICTMLMLLLSSCSSIISRETASSSAISHDSLANSKQAAIDQVKLALAENESELQKLHMGLTQNSFEKFKAGDTFFAKRIGGMTSRTSLISRFLVVRPYYILTAGGGSNSSLLAIVDVEAVTNADTGEFEKIEYARLVKGSTSYSISL